MRNACLFHISSQKACRRGAHQAGAEVEVGGGGRRPLRSRCLLSGLLPHLPQQVGDHIGFVHSRANMRQPFRSQLREETYQSLRSHLLDHIGEEESGQQDAQILETFHKCENCKGNVNMNLNINCSQIFASQLQTQQQDRQQQNL